MTKTCATDHGAGRDPERGAALALQGGGAHGAFTWGVLDRLLEEGLEVHAVCGVSSGALISVMLAQGMVLGGRDGARARARHSDRDPVIPLTSWCAVPRYHGLQSHSPAALVIAARSSARPCA